MTKKSELLEEIVELGKTITAAMHKFFCVTNRKFL